MSSAVCISVFFGTHINVVRERRHDLLCASNENGGASLPLEGGADAFSLLRVSSNLQRAVTLYLLLGTFVDTASHLANAVIML
jgi:hypothetical protein